MAQEARMLNTNMHPRPVPRWIGRSKSHLATENLVEVTDGGRCTPSVFSQGRQVATFLPSIYIYTYIYIHIYMLTAAHL